MRETAERIPFDRAREMAGRHMRAASGDVRDEHFVPLTIKRALDQWASGQYHETGAFLRAVLTNDLFAAAARADVDNAPVLPAIIQYVLNFLPPQCYGSEKKYQAWMKNHSPKREITLT